MVKLLFCGDVNGGWKQLSDRLNDLQNSQHGPFDVLFLTGKCFQSEEEMKNLHALIKFPMKTYSFDNPTYAKNGTLPENLEIIGGGGCGIVSLQHNLTVAYQVNSEISNSNNIENVRQITNSVGYRGCDICITSEWPKEMHHFLDETELNEFKATNIGIGAGNKIASNFAMLVRPRYHFVSGMGVFYQRSPYRNPLLSNGHPGNAFTRLLAIDQVSGSKDKTKKWLHALSVRPIIHLSAAELVEVPASTTDCPYADIGTAVTAPMNKNPFSSTGTTTDDHASKRVRLEGGAAFVPPPPPGAPPVPASQASGSFFFGNMGVPRQGSGGGSGSTNLSPPSDTACTLFIGGLLRTMQDSDLESVLQGVKHIRRPPGKAFAFVEFISHEAAKNTVDTAARRGLNVQGRTLTVGWGKNREDHGSKSNESVENEGSVIERQLIPPSEDAKTLFIAGLSNFVSNSDTTTKTDTAAEDNTTSTTTGTTSNSTVESPLYTALLPLCPGIVSVHQPPGKSYAFVEFDSYTAAMAVVTQSIQDPRSFTLQGAPLVIGWATAPGGDTSRSRLLTAPPSQSSQVLFLGNLPIDITEEQIVGIFNDCEISSIRRPEGREYAFIEFITPLQAQKAMKQSENNEIIINNHVLLLGWAKGRAAEKSNQSAECWFCLASSVVKVHLIVSVAEHTYLALPRGGVTPKHIQICPIECVPSRVHLSTLAKIEMIKFQEAVESMFHKIGAVSLRYERALRTKGSRDHMQMHMIPLGLDSIQLSKSFTVFLQKASQYKLKFHEIQDEQAIDEVVVSMEGGPYQEYFYIEIPIAAGTTSSEGGSGGDSTSSVVWVERPRYRRFVYVQEEGARRFPMQFGLEVAAEILGQPERGHWKHCLLPEDEEAALCDQFRTELAPFDFTLST